MSHNSSASLVSTTCLPYVPNIAFFVVKPSLLSAFPMPQCSQPAALPPPLLIALIPNGQLVLLRPQPVTPALEPLNSLNVEFALHAIVRAPFFLLIDFITCSIFQTMHSSMYFSFCNQSQTSLSRFLSSYLSHAWQVVFLDFTWQCVLNDIRYPIRLLTIFPEGTIQLTLNDQTAVHFP